MSKPETWGVIFVLGSTLLLAACASQSYKHFVKPITDDLKVVAHKLGQHLDLHRDPNCITADCKWKSDALDHE